MDIKIEKCVKVFYSNEEPPCIPKHLVFIDYQKRKLITEKIIKEVAPTEKEAGKIITKNYIVLYKNGKAVIVDRNSYSSEQLHVIVTRNRISVDKTFIELYLDGKIYPYSSNRFVIDGKVVIEAIDKEFSTALYTEDIYSTIQNNIILPAKSTEKFFMINPQTLSSYVMKFDGGKPKIENEHHGAASVLIPLITKNKDEIIDFTRIKMPGGRTISMFSPSKPENYWKTMDYIFKVKPKEILPLLFDSRRISAPPGIKSNIIIRNTFTSRKEIIYTPWGPKRANVKIYYTDPDWYFVIFQTNQVFGMITKKTAFYVYNKNSIILTKKKEVSEIEKLVGVANALAKKYNAKNKWMILDDTIYLLNPTVGDKRFPYMAITGKEVFAFGVPFANGIFSIRGKIDDITSAEVDENKIAITNFVPDFRINGYTKAIVETAINNENLHSWLNMEFPGEFDMEAWYYTVYGTANYKIKFEYATRINAPCILKRYNLTVNELMKEIIDNKEVFSEFNILS